MDARDDDGAVPMLVRPKPKAPAGSDAVRELAEDGFATLKQSLGE